ncbi:uncharacterized protein FYW61_002166 [Anableps anableps]
MATMVSGVCVRVLCIFCLVVVPEVWADHCSSYWDWNNEYHDLKQCDKYCCGDCNNKYCCKNKNERFTEDEQNNCSNRPTSVQYHRIAVIVGSILGAVISVILCVCLICCMAPCCLCYKKCRKQPNQRQIVVTDTVTNMPQPPYSPSGYQASPPGYQAVPGYEGSTLPTAPPPSYMESIASSYPPAAFVPGQAMYPLNPPNQLYGPPLPTDDIAQPPYNPSYGPQP